MEPEILGCGGDEVKHKKKFYNMNKSKNTFTPIPG
jgi:hypothetical protein